MKLVTIFCLALACAAQTSTAPDISQIGARTAPFSKTPEVEALVIVVRQGVRVVGYGYLDPKDFRVTFDANGLAKVEIVWPVAEPPAVLPTESTDALLIPNGVCAEPLEPCLEWRLPSIATKIKHLFRNGIRMQVGLDYTWTPDTAVITFTAAQGATASDTITAEFVPSAGVG